MNRYLGKLFITCFYLFLYIPISILIIFSFNSASFPSAWHNFTFDWYYELFHASHLWTAFFNSLFVAMSAVSMSIFLILSSLFYVFTMRRSNFLSMLFYGNLIVPEIVFAVGMLCFFTLCGISLGMTTLIIAHTGLAIGYSAPVIYDRFNSIDTRLFEASRDLGASTWQSFYRIVVPLLKPALFSSALLTFVISFDDFILAYFCSGSGFETLPLYILSMLRVGVSPVVNALATFSLLLSTACAFFYFSKSSSTQVL